MQHLPQITAEHWYETIPLGSGVTLIHEPHMKAFYRCNMFHVRGRDRDLLIDTGLGAVSLRDQVPLVNERPVICVSSHTHFDHIGSTHEFEERWLHPAEARIQANPGNELTLAAKYIPDNFASEEMFDGLPPGWDAPSYRIKPAPATRLIDEGDVVDIGDRRFIVLHTPGHSPGGISLWEEATGILFAADAVYDGPLVDDTYHSDVEVYLRTMERIRCIPARTIHGGHFGSFDHARYIALIDEYVRAKRANPATMHNSRAHGAKTSSPIEV